MRPKYVCKHLPRKNVLDLTITISCRRKKERKRCATCIPYPVESLTEQPRPSLSALSAAAVFPTSLVHTHSDRKQPPLRLSTPEAVETLIVQYCYCQQRKDGVEIIPCGWWTIVGGTCVHFTLERLNHFYLNGLGLPEISERNVYDRQTGSYVNCKNNITVM